MIMYLELLLAIWAAWLPLLMARRAKDARQAKIWEARDERLARLDEAKTAAQLEAGIAVPLADLVAEAERRVIAEAFPLAGNPQTARVILNSGDSFADSQDVVDAGIVRLFGVPRAINRERFANGGLLGPVTSWTLGGPRLVPEPSDVQRRNKAYRETKARLATLDDCDCDLGTVSEPPTWLPGPARKQIAGLRSHRKLIGDGARALAESATAGDRGFTPAEWDRWNAMNEELRVLDARIDALRRLITE
jgi:hypothetical protein